MPTVVNKHSHTPTNKDYYIGRGSLFGNPFRIGQDGTREEVIEKYRHWLWKAMNAADSADGCRKALLEAGRNYDYFVCFCSPKPCHGDVLVKAYYWLEGH